MGYEVNKQYSVCKGRESWGDGVTLEFSLLVLLKSFPNTVVHFMRQVVYWPSFFSTLFAPNLQYSGTAIF